MIPLPFADTEKEYIVKRIQSQSKEVQAHLNDLGLTVGSTVILVSAAGENVIVNVKGTRLAISAGLASKIYVG